MPRRFNNWKFKQVVDFLKKHHFNFSHAQGSHHIYQGHVAGNIRQVIVPRHDGKPIAIGTMKSIVRQSGISEAEWLGR